MRMRQFAQWLVNNRHIRPPDDTLDHALADFTREMLELDTDAGMLELIEQLRAYGIEESVNVGVISGSELVGYLRTYGEEEEVEVGVASKDKVFTGIALRDLERPSQAHFIAVPTL